MAALTVNVAVLARHYGSWQVLLVRRSRPPTAEAWGLPGRRVKVDELTATAACRVLAEETGVQLDPDELVPVDRYPDPQHDHHGKHASLLYFAALPAPVEPQPGPDTHDARWWPLPNPRAAWDRPTLASGQDDVLREVRRVAPWSPTPTLRRVGEPDVPLVIRLHHAALRAAGTHAGPGPWDDDLEHISAAYLETGGEFLVATIGPVIIGMGALRPVDQATVELKRMRVLPRWQGHGVGRTIAEALLSRARELGFHRVRLDTTAQQQAAINLYTSLGFTQTGTAVVAGLQSLLFTREIQAAD